MGLLQKTIDAYKRNGIVRLPEVALLYLARRVVWKGNSWIWKLEDSLFEQSVMKDFRPLLSRNQVFRNKHKGQRCFVIGNGPSLNKQNLQPLKGELTFVTNFFWKHPVVKLWQPRYYFMSDPFLFTDSEVVREHFNGLAAHIHSSIFFVIHFARQFIESRSLLPPDRTYYVAIGGNGEAVASQGPDLVRIVPDIRTITELALATAIYMGCSPIYMLGCDHDWLAHREAHQNFFGVGDLQKQSVSSSSYQRDLESLLRVWNGYSALKHYASRVGIQIYNATEGGFLDVFDRVSYQSLFAEQRSSTADRSLELITTSGDPNRD
jgi:hypothetical protein